MARSGKVRRFLRRREKPKKKPFDLNDYLFGFFLILAALCMIFLALFNYRDLARWMR